MTLWKTYRPLYKTRLLVIFVLPWLCVSAFSFIYLSHVQRVSGEMNARRHLGIVSDMLAFSVGSGLGDGNFALVQKAFDWSRFDENVVYIGIFDEKNEVIFQTSQTANFPLAKLSDHAAGITMHPGGLLSVAPVTSGGKKLATVFLVYSLEGVEREVRSAQMTSLVMSVLVLLLGLWGTRLLVRQADELESARGEAERQALKVRAQADDLEKINASLAQTNLDLQGTQEQLQSAHDQLEQRVKERTLDLAAANSALRLNQGHLAVAMLAARMSSWKYELASKQLVVSDELLETIGEHTTKPSIILSHVHPDDKRNTLAALLQALRTLKPLDVEFRIVRKGGDISWNASYGKVMRGTDGKETHVVGINMDITERKRSEQALITSLKEKEILLKEVHHRVKNNMQIISSLLSLQSAHVRDKFDVELFRESQLRVKSMALVHERLYRSGDLSSIAFGDYVRTIVKELLSSYRRSGLQITTTIDTLRFGVDAAIPCGLLINEMVTNSIKHAFPDNREGEIEISAYKEGSQVTLTVADNGVGLPPEMDFDSKGTLGVTIIRALCDQLEGSITIDRSSGTRITISFPLHEAGDKGERAT